MGEVDTRRQESGQRQPGRGLLGGLGPQRLKVWGSPFFDQARLQWMTAMCIGGYTICSLKGFALSLVLHTRAQSSGHLRHTNGSDMVPTWFHGSNIVPSSIVPSNIVPSNIVPTWFSTCLPTVSRTRLPTELQLHQRQDEQGRRTIAEQACCSRFGPVSPPPPCRGLGWAIFVRRASTRSGRLRAHRL